MKLCTVVLVLVFLSSCTTTPKPINYGSDACSFCQMTIVDNQHAAQIVTEKGRSYKYDAIECMLNDFGKWERPEVAQFLVSNYSKPGELVNAEDAWYLISEEIPSPMGAFLTAFSTEGDRSIHVDDRSEKHDWKSLNSKFQNLSD